MNAGAIMFKKKMNSENNVMKLNRDHFGAAVLTVRTMIAGIMSILMLVIISGCEDALLNQKPQGELTVASFFETEEHALEATNATYEHLRNFNVHSLPWLAMTDIASDDANKGSEPADGPPHAQLDDWSFDFTNPNFQGTWGAYYQGIYRANLAIENIPNVTEMDDSLRERLIGENKFLRAYYYYFLVRSFGGVPLITEPQEPGEFQVPRASAADVFSFIEQDLQDAIDALPEKSEYAQADLGRTTKGAARSMLANVLLYQEKYDQAEQYARDVINSGEYSLYPDYEEMFQPRGENSSESVFEVQAVAVEPNQGGTQYSQPQGPRGGLNMGWGFNNPSDELLEAYEPGDPRLGATVLFIHETLPFGPAEVVPHNDAMPDNQRYNQKSLVPLDQPGGAASGNGGTNQRIIRYADVLLIAAEAAFHNGNEQDARDWVNQVRERARNGQSVTLGIEVEAVSSVVAEAAGDPSYEGRPFARFVAEGGPAGNAGIQDMRGSVMLFGSIDIIQSIDGTAVSDPEEFGNELNSKNPGDVVDIEVLRITDVGSEPDTQTVGFSITADELLPDVTSGGQQLLEAVWHERRVELAMEQHRMWDLRRTGRDSEVLRAAGKNFEENKHELYPIPREELQLNPELEQNPGYGN